MSAPYGTGEQDTDGDDLRRTLLAGAPVTDSRQELAGIPTAVLTGGDGPPVVLLHGPGGFAAEWRQVIADLVADHRVVVPDLPGHGTSGTGNGELDAARAVRWLAGLIDATCDQPPVVVGQALGGGIAIRYACEHGDRLSVLVLVDTFGLAPLRPSPRTAVAVGGFLARPTIGSHTRLVRQLTSDLEGLRQRWGELAKPLEEYCVVRTRATGARTAQNQLIRHLAATPVPPEDLARLTVPTHLIWGRHDRMVRLPVAERASARYGWPLHVLDGAGAAPYIEHPARFTAALRVALGHQTIS
jgi:pimeloyl-ACP methyl ester carboxylesterase